MLSVCNFTGTCFRKILHIINYNYVNSMVKYFYNLPKCMSKHNDAFFGSGNYTWLALIHLTHHASIKKDFINSLTSSLKAWDEQQSLSRVTHLSPGCLQETLPQLWISLWINWEQVPHLNTKPFFLGITHQDSNCLSIKNLVAFQLEEGSVPSGKDVLVFLCTAFSISIHNLLAALCWTSVGLPSWQEGHIPSECKCSENTLAASYNYILFGQYLLSYFGLMHQYVLFLCRTSQTKANNQLSSIATKRSKLLWFVFCATFGANTSSTYITWGARMWKIGHRHGRGPSNGRDMDRRVVQVSQYLGRSLVSKQQATCNQVLCMQPHRGVYRMRPPRYTLLGPKFETNAPAFSRNTVQVPAVLVAAHWTKLASAKWSISSSDSVHLVYRG